MEFSGRIVDRDHDADTQSQKGRGTKQKKQYIPLCLCAFVPHIACFSRQHFILLIKSVSSTYGMTSRTLALVMAT